MTTFTYASAFAGIGGMTMGLEPVGFKGVVAWEYDPTEKRRQYAQEAHQMLHPQVPMRGDIRDTDLETIPDMDLFCFTPPCQAFSYSGKRGGTAFVCLDCKQVMDVADLLVKRTATCPTCGGLAVPKDDRGVLTYDALRIVKAKRPKMLLMENVKGLLGHEKGATLQAIIQSINELGYLVDFTVINSMYFGVGQKRERLYLVAAREDLVEQAQWECAGNTSLMKFKRRMQAIGVGSFKFNFPKQEVVQRKLDTFLEKDAPLNYYYTRNITERVTSHIPFDVSKIPLKPLPPVDLNGSTIKRLGHMGVSITRHKVLRESDIAHTILARDYNGASNYAGNAVLELCEVGEEQFYRLRKFTARECFALQAVPECYAEMLLRNFTERRCYRFAGNGLTISVVQAIGAEIVQVLREMGTAVKND